MANFVLLYGGPGDMPETEEETQAVMAAWGAWYGSMGDAVVDGGNPMSPVAKVIASDGSVSDAAFGSTPTGYTIISADSLDAAVEMAKGCPVLEGEGNVTVLETFDVM